MKLKSARVAMVGISAIVASVLASPATAKIVKAQTVAKEQLQRHATHRSRNATAPGGGRYPGSATGANATAPSSRTFDSYTNY